MGLDQYAWQLLDGTDEDGARNKTEVAYWRKHPNLQGWMEALWREKGLDSPIVNRLPEGTADSGEYGGLDTTDAFGHDKVFNCEELPLTLEDIQNLRKAILGEALPGTQGFFFGEDSDDYYRQQDLEFCDNAEEILKNGGEVVYWSWW
jgi:hypothetical protein